MQNQKVDLIYTEIGMFILFLPESNAGEIAWAQIAKKTNGTGKIFKGQLQGTLAQLRNAGYTVRKGKKPTKSIDDILNDLDLI